MDVPPDQLERIQPALEALQAQLQPLLADLPDAPEFAIQFSVENL